MKIRLTLYGETHNDVAISHWNIATSFGTLKDYKKGIEYYEKSLQIKKNVFSENHDDVANLLRNIGISYNDLGESRKAIDYH